jgi:hypothetical protein
MLIKFANFLNLLNIGKIFPFWVLPLECWQGKVDQKKKVAQNLIKNGFKNMDTRK